jgi:SAM-dependent methyltransferase/tetratricopeptide (TPR) repeat protein
MYVTGLDVEIDREYKSILQHAMDSNAGKKFLRISERYAEGAWKSAVEKIDAFVDTLAGSVVLDCGCKFGHLTPLLLKQGATKVYSVDVGRDHTKEGAAFIGAAYGSEYPRFDEGYLEVPSESVDKVLVNDVLSSLNTEYEQAFLAEIARVLKPDGEVVVYDNYNLNHGKTISALVDSYTVIELSGADGRNNETNTETRAGFIARAFPVLSSDKVRYVAENTSGLWGDRLKAVVRRFLEDGNLIERPYSRGMYPIHPVSGSPMKRGFFPAQLELSLWTYGIDAVQIVEGLPIASEQDRGRKKNIIVRGRKARVDQLGRRRFKPLEKKAVPSVVKREEAHGGSENPELATKDGIRMEKREIEMIGAARFAAKLGGKSKATSSLLSEITLAANTAKASGRVDDFIELTYAALSVDRDNPGAKKLASAVLALAVSAGKEADRAGDANDIFNRWLYVLHISPGDGFATRRVLKAAADLTADGGADAEFEIYQQIIAVAPRSAVAVRKLISSALRARSFQPALDILVLYEAGDVAPDMFMKLMAAAFTAARLEYREGKLVESARILACLQSAKFVDDKFKPISDAVRKRVVSALRAALTADSREDAAKLAEPLSLFDPLTVDENQVLARYLGKYGDAKDALPYLLKLKDLEPESARRWFDLARGQRRAGEKNAAQKSIRMAQEIDPKDKKILEFAQKIQM